MENLDKICAEYGNKIAEAVAIALSKESEKGDYKQAENLIIKALGVLQEQGLYAYALFCKSEEAAKLIAITKEFLKDKLSLLDDGDLLQEIRKDDGLASKLDHLLLATQMIEKALIYARYHAKAKKTEKESQSNANTSVSETQGA